MTKIPLIFVYCIENEHIIMLSCWKSIKNILGYFICLVLVLPVSSKGQDSVLLRNPLLAHLYHSATKDIQITQNGNNLFFENDNYHFSNRVHVLLKTGNDLFIFPTGTGRVYQAIAEINGSVKFKRIDSTHFYGYNGNCIYFSHNGLLFSFGGGGYWRNNGQLRDFNKNYREWNIVKINKEYRVLNALFFDDAGNNKLYYLEFPWTDPSTGFIDPEYELITFDMNSKQNERIGNLSPKFVELLTKNPDFSIVSVPSFNGVLLNINNENQYLVNFKKKQVQKIASHRLKEAFYGNSNNQFPVNCFAEDSTIYYTLNGDSSFTLYKTYISKNDLSDVAFNLCESNLEYWWWLVPSIMVLLILSIASIKLYLRKKTKDAADQMFDFSQIFHKDKNELSFTTIEWKLMNAIHRESLKGAGLTVEQINAEIGLAKKSLEIQKKIRTDVLNSINQTFRVISGLDEDLIERMRNPDDRRFFIYRILEGKWKLLISKME